MAINGVPWYTGGSAIHSPQSARHVLYEATEGNTGVDEFGDLKVTATATASNQVQIAAGTGAMKSRYASAFGESYDCIAPSATLFTIPATDSTAGATRYLVVRVMDPAYPGQAAPANLAAGPYIFPELTATDPGLRGEKLPYPNIPLAKIVQPASTSTITNAMITDLRRLVMPKRLEDSVMLYRTTDLNMPKGTYGSWPASGNVSNVEVPEWATHIQIRAVISGIQILGTAGVEQAGGIRTAFGGVGHTQASIVSGEGNAIARQSVSVMGEHVIAANQRSTLQAIAIQGNHTTPANSTGFIQSDYQTNMEFAWVFLNRPM